MEAMSTKHSSRRVFKSVFSFSFRVFFSRFVFFASSAKGYSYIHCFVSFLFLLCCFFVVVVFVCFTSYQRLAVKAVAILSVAVYL